MFGLGVRIMEDALMVEDGEPYEVCRTWRERLFSTPWRPLRTTRTAIPKVPKMDAVRLPDGTLVMHPEMMARLRELHGMRKNLRDDFIGSNV